MFQEFPQLIQAREGIGVGEGIGVASTHYTNPFEIEADPFKGPDPSTLHVMVILRLLLSLAKLIVKKLNQLLQAADSSDGVQ